MQINVTALRAAIHDCSERRLGETSKWLADLLMSLPADQRRSPASATSPVFHTSTPARRRVSDGFDLLAEAAESQYIENEFDGDEEDVVGFCQQLFDNREFERCALKLDKCRGSKARFLNMYAKYLSSERRALNKWHALDSSRYKPVTPLNDEAARLLDEIRETTDPFLLFLKGVLLFRLKRRTEALAALIASLNTFPWNWGAWLQMVKCFGDRKEVEETLHLLPDHPLRLIFCVKIANETQAPIDRDAKLADELIATFPESGYLMGQRALLAYYQRDYDIAERLYDKTLLLDPYRLDIVDAYSNILYVTQKRLKLSKLAHDFMKLDKNTPEACYLTGTHYSLRGEHEKSAKYYRRAVQLNPSYVPAWTLLGHEYLEMKNSHAAIEAYRHAVELDNKDYRGWYGLGQAYEFLNMQQYALHYYQRATTLGPYEVRVWKALGTCYQDLNKPHEAITCYRRALLCVIPSDVNLHLKIAGLYEFVEDRAAAATYHRAAVELGMREPLHSSEWAKSAVFVARWLLELRAAGTAPEPGDLAITVEGLKTVTADKGEDALGAADLLRRLNR